MVDMDFEKAIELAEAELMQKIEERKNLDRRIGQLNLALRGLANTLSPDRKKELLNRLAAVRRKPAGLTESIREALQEFKEGMTGSEVRAYLETSGFDLSEYSQPLATIMTTLGRLRESKEVFTIKNQKGAIVFKWKK